MKKSADEIVSILREEISNYNVQTQRSETGTVLDVGDGIATVYGLDNAVYGELVEFDTGVRGMSLHSRRMAPMSPSSQQERAFFTTSCSTRPL